jgi:hypothetical protein
MEDLIEIDETRSIEKEVALLSPNFDLYLRGVIQIVVAVVRHKPFKPVLFYVGLASNISVLVRVPGGSIDSLLAKLRHHFEQREYTTICQCSMIHSRTRQ